jgi:hypothetical protein
MCGDMWRKWLRLGLLGLVLAATALPGWVVLESRDLDRVSDADLVVDRLNLAHDDNGTTWLVAAADRVPADVWGANELSQSCAREPDPPHDWARYGDAVARSRKALRLVDRFIAAPELQIAPYSVTGPDDAVSGNALWLSRLLCADARLHMRARRYPAALEAWQRFGRFGARVEATRGGVLIHGIMGVQFKRVALDGIHEVLAEHRLAPSAARALAQEIERWRAHPDVWPRLWRAEYRAVTDSVAELDAGERPTSRLETSIEAVRLGAERYTLYPNRARHAIAGWHRVFAAEAGRPCSAQSKVAQEGFDLYGMRELARENGANYASFRTRLCSFATQASLLQARLALEAYQAEHHALPSTLCGLVPAQLERTPRDGFNGAPLRYSRERRRVWSVGADLRNANGNGSLDDADEPTLVLASPR